MKGKLKRWGGLYSGKWCAEKASLSVQPETASRRVIGWQAVSLMGIVSWTVDD